MWSVVLLYFDKDTQSAGFMSFIDTIYNIVKLPY